MSSLICAWINGWANNWDAGDLRRHRALRRHCNAILFIGCEYQVHFRLCGMYRHFYFCDYAFVWTPCSKCPTQFIDVFTLFVQNEYRTNSYHQCSLCFCVCELLRLYNDNDGGLCFVIQKQYASTIHDDVIYWKYFPRYWPFVRGIYRPPVDSPH